MKRMKRALSLILTAALLLTLYVPASAQETSSSVDILMNMDDKAPEGYSEDIESPYGYPKDQPFDLSTSNELAFFTTANGNDLRHFGLEDTNGDSLSNLNSFVKDPEAATGGSDFSSASGTWSFVQATAFDPLGSGRNDHIIFVGVKSKKAYAWVSKVISGETKTVSGTLELSSMSWLDNNYEQFQSTSLFDIVAGDFDADGKDTAVIYTPGSGNTGCTLWEVTFSGSTLSSAGSSRDLLMDAYFTDSSDVYSDSGKNCKDIRRDKLAVSMTVSDLTGDNIDDLAVLSYCHRTSDKNVPISYYEPTLKVVYGSGNMSDTVIKQNPNNSFKIYDGTSSRTFPVAASLVSGDFNADTVDELFVVGAKATATVSGSNVDDRISVTDKSWYMQGVSNSIDSQGTVTLSLGGYYTVSTNAWWEGGFYSKDDDAWGEVMAEAAAFEGVGVGEKLFVAGSVFDVSAKNTSPKYTYSYFNESDDGAGSTAVSNTFIQSVSVGNFDGNTYGREQVVYTIGLKEAGQDDYSYKLGYMAATFDSNTQLSTGYTNSSISGASYVYNNRGDNLDEGLNCFTVAIDNDYDGTKAKYMGATFAYADPEVKAVLQTAPFFGEITDFSYSSTSYTLETSQSNVEGWSSSWGGNIGLAGGFTAAVVSANASLAYAGSWTTSQQKEISHTFSETYTALTQDIVVVHRTPVIIYHYSLQDKNGNWSQGSEMDCIIPQEPVSVTLSVDDYNKFVDEYNSSVENAIKSNSEFKDEKWDRLVKLDLDDNYLDGNEGNPYAYNTSGWSGVSPQNFDGGQLDANAEVLSKSPHQMGYTGGATQVSWTESNATTKSTDVTNGISFSFSVTVGNYVGPVTGGAGITGGANYARGSLTSETIGSLIGTSCSVRDVDKNALVASGVPGNVVDSYGFSWNMMKWERHLSGNTDPNADLDNDGEVDGITMTPIVGYYLQDVRSPSLSVTDLKADAISADEVVLSWSKPQQYYGWPSISGYKIYVVTSDANPYKLIKTVGANETQAVITDAECKAAGYASGLAAGGTDSFVVTSYHTSTDGDENESVWSNKATVTMLDTQYTLTYAADKTDTLKELTAYEYGDKTLTITSGATDVREGTNVTIKAVPETGCEVLGFEVYSGTTPVAYLETSDSEGGKYCTFPVNSNVSVKVLTKGAESTVSFASSVGDGVNVIGTVSAQSGGANFTSGGTVAHTGSVTFTAAPEAGYKLTGWSIKQWDGTDSAAAAVTCVNASGNTYTLRNPSYDNYEVTAQFGERIIKNPTITVTAPAIGGSITLTDKNGNTIPTDSEGKATVPFGTLVNITALPQLDSVSDNGSVFRYVFSGWTGSLVNETEATVQMRVLSDMTVGASFKKAEKLTVSHKTAGGGTGTVYTYPETQSGSPAELDEGTKMAVAVKATAGSYIKRVIAKTTDADGTEEIIFNCSEDGYKTEASRLFILNKSVEIIAEFETIPTANVTVTSTGSGTVKVLQNGTEPTTSTFTAKYTDNIVVTAAPNTDFAPLPLGGNHPEWVYSTADKNYSITYDGLSDALLTNGALNIEVGFAGLWEIPTDGTGYTIESVSRGFDYVQPTTHAVVGDNVEFAVVPAENYKIFGVTVTNGGSVTGTDARLVKIGGVQSDTRVTVDARQALNLTNNSKVEQAAVNNGYVIVRDNGKIVRDGAAIYEGDKLTVNAHPIKGYEVENNSVSINDVDVNNGTTTTVGKENVSVNAVFSRIKYRLPTSTDDYTVTVLGGAESTASNPQNVNWGEDVTITLTPKNGKFITDVSVNIGTAKKNMVQVGTSTDEDGKELIKYEHDGSWTVEFWNVQQEIVLTATTANVYTLTVDDTVQNGAISVLRGNDAVASGGKIFENEVLTVSGEPAEGYRLGSVTVNGTKISGTEFTVTGDSTVSGEFTDKPAGGGDTGGAGDGEGGENTCPKDETCPISKFSDASPTAWYHDGVHYALENGLMQGTSETTFSPRVDTSRAMLVTMLYRLEGEPEVSGENPFSDVPESEYYYAPIMWAVENEIVLGYANGTYKPGRAIDRQDFAVIMYRYAQYKGYDVSMGDSFTITGYNDADEISDYALTAMQWAVGEGLLQGVSETEMRLDPLGSTVRAQTATIFQRFCEKYMDLNAEAPNA